MFFRQLATREATLSYLFGCGSCHVAGSVCGAGISGKPASTIGFEKRWNPMLALDREAFIAALTAEIPPRPAEMERMVKANLGLAA